MLKVVICVLSAIVAVQSAWDHTNYCTIDSCDGRPHTFWVYRSEQPAAACDQVIKAGLTDAEKRKILNLHNALRQRVARGEETRGNPGPQPPARNMRIMEWDEELADLAQRWANQCNFALDQCRDVERFPVGQQLYQWWVSDDVMKIDVGEMVKDWYNYVDHVDANSISNYNYQFDFGQSLYTQMVWAESYKLGCGAIRYPIPSGKRFTLVCNYGPGGNMIGQPVYKIY